MAQYLAERGGQLIVSADSMNLYCGMDIGTAKPSGEEREKVDYAGIDLAEPTEKFSVADYLSAVKPAFNRDGRLLLSAGQGSMSNASPKASMMCRPKTQSCVPSWKPLIFRRWKNAPGAGAPNSTDQLTEDDRQNPRRLIRILEKSCGAGFPSLTGIKWNSKPKPKPRRLAR